MPRLAERLQGAVVNSDVIGMDRSAWHMLDRSAWYMLNERWSGSFDTAYNLLMPLAAVCRPIQDEILNTLRRRASRKRRRMV